MRYPSKERNEFNNISREKLGSMSTAELLELLETINETMSEDNFNEELVMACLDELDKKSPMPAYLSTDESWQSFENNVRFHSDTGKIDNIDFNTTGRKVKRVFRTGLVAVITVFCLFSCLIVAQASGADVFGSIARWTDSVFGFGEYGNLREDVVASSNHIGSWIEKIESWLLITPSDFTMGVPDVLIDQTSGAIMYSVQYQSDEDTISFDAITQSIGNTESLFEKDNTAVNEVMVKNVPVYLFSNNGESIAAWYVDEIEFSISTNLDIESLENLVRNSYGG